MFLGLWVIGYGFIQAVAPSVRNLWGTKTSPGVSSVQFWSAVLTAIPGFAMNSSIHSYMVLAYTDKENVSLNVGFYYMANAAGRLIGTLLSGVLFMLGSNASIGMQVCLWCSSLFVLLSCLTSLSLPSLNNSDFFEKDSAQA